MNKTQVLGEKDQEDLIENPGSGREKCDHKLEDTKYWRGKALKSEPAAISIRSYGLWIMADEEKVPKKRDVNSWGNSLIGTQLDGYFKNRR